MCFGAFFEWFRHSSPSTTLLPIVTPGHTVTLPPIHMLLLFRGRFMHNCMLQFRDRMVVRMGCVRHEMVVAVGVRDRMRMDAAAVEMRVGMLVRMGMVPHERVDDDERRTRDHHGESGADALLSFTLKSDSPAIPMPAPR